VCREVRVGLRVELYNKKAKIEPKKCGGERLQYIRLGIIMSASNSVDIDDVVCQLSAHLTSMADFAVDGKRCAKTMFVLPYRPTRDGKAEKGCSSGITQTVPGSPCE
jgi:hypothetical protein